MNIINLTPHAIVLVSETGETATIQPSGQIARCSQRRETIGSVTVGALSVSMTRNVMGALEGLPPATEDTVFIVSLVAAKAAADAGRTEDILVPDDAVRDADGKIIGCRALARQ